MIDCAGSMQTDIGLYLTKMKYLHTSVQDSCPARSPIVGN